MTEIDRILEHLALNGPVAFRALDPTERAWRGRYLLMVAAMGASPIFAWANALASDVDGSDQTTIELVASASDDVIATAIARSDLQVDDLAIEGR